MAQIFFTLYVSAELTFFSGQKNFSGLESDTAYCLGFELSRPLKARISFP